MLRIGFDRIGVTRPVQSSKDGECSEDGARGVFKGTSLVCPRCGKVLGGV